MAAHGYLTVREAAVRSGFSPKTIYRAIRSGALEASRPTAHYRISAEGLERWLSSRINTDAKAASQRSVAPARLAVASLQRLREIEREPA